MELHHLRKGYRHTYILVLFTMDHIWHECIAWPVDILTKHVYNVYLQPSHPLLPSSCTGSDSWSIKIFCGI